MFVCTNDKRVDWRTIRRTWTFHWRFFDKRFSTKSRNREKQRFVFGEESFREREKFHCLSRNWTVLKWFHEYEHGKLDVFDSSHSGRIRSAVIDEMIDAVRLMIDDDPHLTYQQIDFSLGINSPVIYSILHDSFKATEDLYTMGQTFHHKWSKNQFEFNLKRIHQRRSQCVFWHCDWRSTLIVSSLSSSRQTSTEKSSMYKDDRGHKKNLWNEWPQLSSSRCEPTESIDTSDIYSDHSSISRCD